MRVLSPTLLVLAIVPLGAATLEDTLSELKESLAYGKTSLFLRARSETVDSSFFDNKAHANTMRVALGYETKPFHAFSVGLQYEGVYNLGRETYNSNFNGQTTYPVVGDATDVSELQQAYVRYAPSYIPGLMAIAGRQDINLENQRYIGTVSWRQDWQCFDAVNVAWKPTQGVLKGAEFGYAYLDDVHRTTPEGTAQGDINMNGHAISVAYALCAELRVLAYDYIVDFDVRPGGPQATPFLGQSTQTTGLRATGAWKFSDPWGVLYAAEYAKQSDYDTNPVDIDATYTLLELGASYKALTLKAGYELLGGNDSVAGDKFTTPLATLHAFQGWADMFTTTPRGGLVDTYLWLAGPLPFAAVENFKVGAAYHDFKADDRSEHYGTEIDLLVEYSVKVFDPKLILGAKYASYKADDGDGALLPGSTIRNVDTDKIWFYTQYSF